MKKFLEGNLLAIGLIVLLLVGSAAAFAWNISHQKQPEVAFWEALEAGLGTPGITCTITKNEKGRLSVQSFSLDLASKSNLRSVSRLTQNSTSVTTEGISTKTADYVRYTDIRLSAAGTVSTKDFSKVLNVWSKQARISSSAVPLYDQTALGGCVAPLADLSQGQKDKSMAELKSGKIFSTDFSKAKWHWSWDHPTLVYTVTVPPDRYVPFMKSLAAVQGLQGLDDVNPAAYAEKTPGKLYFQIGASSHRLQRIIYDNQDVTVRFSDYGKVPDITVPQQTIPSAKLQKRIQSVK